jgi:hypothetical protein
LQFRQSSWTPATTFAVGDSFVQEALAEVMAEDAQRCEISVDQIIGEAAKLAFLNMMDYIRIGDPMRVNWKRELAWGAVLGLFVVGYFGAKGLWARTSSLSSREKRIVWKCQPSGISKGISTGV